MRKNFAVLLVILILMNTVLLTVSQGATPYYGQVTTIPSSRAVTEASKY